MKLPSVIKDFELNDVILYFLIFALMIYASKMEKKDLLCPWDGCPNEMCKEGNGVMYHGCKVEPGDSKKDLIHKILKCGNINRKTVYWRRSLMLTFLGLLISWLVLFHRIPKGSEMMTGLFIIGGLWYYSFSFYNYHHFDHSQQRMKLLLTAFINNDKNNNFVLI